MVSEPESLFSQQVSNARQLFLGFSETKTDLHVVSVGAERCGQEYVVERENFDFSVLELVAVGKGTLWMNQKKYPLSAGSVFLYTPGVSHRIESLDGLEMLKYFMVLDGVETAKFVPEILKNDVFFRQISDFADLVELFELILANAPISSPQTSPICSSLAQALILKAIEKKENLPANQTRSWTTYNRVLQHIRKHYLRLKSVNQLAKETHLDPAYLSRVFKSFHKESPYAFLVRLKMGHAASLLLKSDTLVKDVAYELGFDNPCHFSRSFKKAFGVAPEKFSGRFDA